MPRRTDEELLPFQSVTPQVGAGLEQLGTEFQEWDARPRLQVSDWSEIVSSPEWTEMDNLHGKSFDGEIFDAKTAKGELRWHFWKKVIEKDERYQAGSEEEKNELAKRFWETDSDEDAKFFRTRELPVDRKFLSPVKEFARGVVAEVATGIPKALAGVTQQVGELSGAEGVAEVGRVGVEMFEDPYRQRELGLMPRGETWAERGAFKLGAAAGTVTEAIASGQVSLAIPAVLFGLRANANVYVDARRKGNDPLTSTMFSLPAGITEGALESLGVGIILKKYTGVLRHALAGVVTEAAQEWSQETGGNLIQMAYDEDKRTFKGAFEGSGEAALIGAIIGGPAGAATDIHVEGFARDLVRSAGIDPTTEEGKFLKNIFKVKLNEAAEDVRKEVAEAEKKEPIHPKEGERKEDGEEIKIVEPGEVTSITAKVYRAGDLTTKVSTPPDLEGVYFADSPESASTFAQMGGEAVEEYNIQLQRPATEAIEQQAMAQLGETQEIAPGLLGYSSEQMAQNVATLLQESGYDGVVRETGEIIAFNPEEAIMPIAPTAPEVAPGATQAVEAAPESEMPPAAPVAPAEGVEEVKPAEEGPEEMAVTPTDTKATATAAEFATKKTVKAYGLDEDLTIKKQSAQFAANVKAAIAEASDSEDEVIEFAVPGGSMKIVNTKKALQNFSENAPSIFSKPGKEKGAPKAPKYVRPQPPTLQLSPTEDEGVITDGKMLIKGEWEGKAKIKDSSPISKETTDRLLKVHSKDAAKAEFVQYRWKDESGQEGMSAKPLMRSTAKGEDATVVFRSEMGDTFYVQDKFLVLQKLQPDATYKVSKEYGSLVAYVGNEVVGIIMPIQRKGESIFAEKGTKTVKPPKGVKIEGATAAPAPVGTSKTHRAPKQMERTKEGTVTKAEIIKQMEKTGKAIIRFKHGRFKQRKALGWFHPKWELIRLQEAEDIVTGAHEVGHAINKKVLGWKMKLPKGVRAELLEMGKELYGDRKPVSGYAREGWAEYMARYLFDEDMGIIAPKTHDWFHNTILPKDSAFSEDVATLKEMVGLWEDQGAIGRINAQINRVKHGPRDILRRGFESLQAAFSQLMWTNDSAPMDKAVNKLLVEGDVDPESIRPDEDPVRLRAALKLTAPGQARYLLEKGLGGSSLSDIMQPVKDRIEDFYAYIYARRGLDLLNRDAYYEKKADEAETDAEAASYRSKAEHYRENPINPGISREDAQYAVDTLQSKEFDAALEGITEWSNYLVDYIVSAGGLSVEAADAMRDLNPIYVPLKRFFDENMLGGSRGRGSKGMVNQPKAVFGIKGSGRQVIDFMESLMQQANFMISLGNKLQVGKALVELAEKVEGSAWFAHPVELEMKADQFTVERIADDLAKAGIDLDGADLSQVVTVFSNAQQYHGKDNIITVWRGGKQEFWEVDPAIYKVVTEMDKEHLPATWRMITGPFKRAVQLGATGLDLAFSVIRNPIRDAFTSAVYSQSGRQVPVLNTLRGFWKDIKGHPDVELWRALGGDMGTLMGQDRVSTKAAVDRAMARGYKEKGIVTLQHPVDALRSVMGALEAATRIEEFSRVLKLAEAKYGEGSRAAHIEALLASKEVTINFTRGGIISAALNGMIPFFNARVQGATKFYRAFLKDPKKAGLEASLRAFTWVTVPSMLLWWINRDEEWYKELPKWRRFGYWNFSFDDGKTIFSIPKPFEIGYVFGTIPEVLAQHAYERDPELVLSAMWETFQTFLPAQNLLDIAPAIVKPGFEVWTNYNSFRGRVIDPQYEADVELPKDRYSKYTTETAKAIGELLGVSPRKVEHLMSGYTGGLMLDTIVSAERLFGVRKDSGEPSKNDWPVVGTIFARSPYGNGRSVNDFYERLQELRQKKGSKALDRSEKSQLIRMETASKIMANLRKQRDRGQKSTEEANERITKLARKALKRS